MLDRRIEGWSNYENVQLCCRFGEVIVLTKLLGGCEYAVCDRIGYYDALLLLSLCDNSYSVQVSPSQYDLSYVDGALNRYKTKVARWTLFPRREKEVSYC